MELFKKVRLDIKLQQPNLQFSTPTATDPNAIIEFVSTVTAGGSETKWCNCWFGFRLEIFH
jgi:hypothetical protein